jgi:hypothetical protein
LANCDGICPSGTKSPPASTASSACLGHVNN